MKRELMLAVIAIILMVLAVCTLTGAVKQGSTGQAIQEQRQLLDELYGTPVPTAPESR